MTKRKPEPEPLPDGQAGLMLEEARRRALERERRKIDYSDVAYHLRAMGYVIVRKDPA